MSTQQVLGIDVSLYQKTIDWGKVMATARPFAFVKASQSNTITDPCFAANWHQAKAAGLLRGAYIYFQNGVDGLAQAQRFIGVVGSDHGELPPVVDVEDPNGAASVTDLKRCLDAIEAAFGRKPIIYTANWYWNASRWGGPVAWARQYDLWVASYTPSPILPGDWSGWKFWQNAVGAVDGIAAAVDLDVFNGSVDDLHAYSQTRPSQADPSEPKTIPVMNNQAVINVFFHAFGQSFWDKVTSAGLTSMAIPRTNRTLTYSGPAIEDLPSLTDAEKAALIGALSKASA